MCFQHGINRVSSCRTSRGLLPSFVSRCLSWRSRTLLTSWLPWRSRGSQLSRCLCNYVCPRCSPSRSGSRSRHVGVQRQIAGFLVDIMLANLWLPGLCALLVLCHAQESTFSPEVVVTRNRTSTHCTSMAPLWFCWLLEP